MGKPDFRPKGWGTFNKIFYDDLLYGTSRDVPLAFKKYWDLTDEELDVMQWYKGTLKEKAPWRLVGESDYNVIFQTVLLKMKPAPGPVIHYVETHDTANLINFLDNHLANPQANKLKLSG